MCDNVCATVMTDMSNLVFRPRYRIGMNKMSARINQQRKMNNSVHNKNVVWRERECWMFAVWTDLFWTFYRRGDEDSINMII